MAHASRRPEILYLSYDGLTDSLGQSQILPYLQGLAADHSITIITFEKPENFKRIGTSVRMNCCDAGIVWQPLTYHKSPKVLSTLYDLFVLRRAVRSILSTKKIDIIHCRSYLTSITGLWAKKVFGAAFIFDMRGFWPDERVDGGLWNLRNPLSKSIYKYFKAKEREFVRHADHIVTLTENARTEIRSWGLSQVPISVIPTCVDMELFDPEKEQDKGNAVRRELSIAPQDFVLLYSGSWGTWYITDDILEFFSVLLSFSPHARLLILTPHDPGLKGYRHLERVTVKRVDRKEVPAYLQAANAAICFIKPCFSKIASSATKVAEAWSMNLPVVTNPGWGDIERLYATGFPLMMCNSKSDYYRVAGILAQHEKPRKRGMLYGEFDLASGIAKYRSIYRSLAV